MQDSLPPTFEQLRFSITRQDLDGVCVVAVHGELDLARAPQLGVAVSEALRSHPTRLVIDLCDVGFVDSGGLSILLNARRRAVRQGVELKLACDVESTLRLLSLTRLDRDFDVHATRHQAIAA